MQPQLGIGGDDMNVRQTDAGSWLKMSDGTRTTIELDANYTNGTTPTGHGAVVRLANAEGKNTVIIDAHESESDPAATIQLSNGTRETVEIDAGSAGGGSHIGLGAEGNGPTVLIEGDSDDDGAISLYDNLGHLGVWSKGDDASGGGRTAYFRDDGTQTVEIAAAASTLRGGQINLYKADGTKTITIDAEYDGDGRITTQELRITGGSDFSEQFEIRAPENERSSPTGREGWAATQRRSPTGREGRVQPGMVLCIDPAKVGRLVVSDRPYDRRVAGIVSGAGGIKTGLLMGQEGTKVDGAWPVALSGRVYCWCDAANGAIEPGDLLTTSDTPGHAMKVSDHTRAQGAILGKAMSGLKQGKGLVLVLVSLQ